MTALDERVRMHLGIWLNALERAAKHDDVRSVEIRKLAEKWQKTGALTEAQWLINSTSKGHLIQTVEAVRLKLTTGDVVEAFEIYRRYEETRLHIAALLNQPDIIRGRTTFKAARSGGEARKGKFEPGTNAILAEMRRLHEGGKHSISRAAEIVFLNGLGTSSGANRKLWDRHK